MTNPRTKKMLLVAASVSASGIALACGTASSQTTGFPDSPPYDGPDTSSPGFPEGGAAPDGAIADASDGGPDEDASDASDANDDGG
jgi:hypothetical protein